ncbi:MAG: hypothetical protein EZS28_010340 [Streblomastix strix]|uniref:MROH2B-like N-terminal HEAT-repeats domain-containing protein n=1 Tax=Streblomastix strix TaxID=222440 RepID=A0A5J4WHT0_9EUKA|nr:MAG: hypothetical protein EZS28_010340 [Streblomastix strix]
MDILNETISALVSAADDVEDVVRSNVKLALCSIGRRNPQLVISQICLAINAQNIHPSQKSLLMETLENIVRENILSLKSEDFNTIILFSINEICLDQDILNHKGLSVQIFAVVSSMQPQLCYDEILKKISPQLGTFNENIIQALNEFTQRNPYFIFGRLKEIFASLVPQFSSIKNNHQKQIMAEACRSFAEAITFVVRKGNTLEKGTRPEDNRNIHFKSKQIHRVDTNSISSVIVTSNLTSSLYSISYSLELLYGFIDSHPTNEFETEMDIVFDMLQGSWLSNFGTGGSERCRLSCLWAIGKVAQLRQLHFMESQQLLPEEMRFEEDPFDSYETNFEKKEEEQNDEQNGSLEKETTIERQQEFILRRMEERAGIGTGIKQKVEGAKKILEPIMNSALDKTFGAQRAITIGTIAHMVSLLGIHIEPKKTQIFSSLSSSLNDGSLCVRFALIQLALALSRNGILDDTNLEALIRVIIMAVGSPVGWGEKQNKSDKQQNQNYAKDDNVTQTGTNSFQNNSALLPIPQQVAFDQSKFNDRKIQSPGKNINLFTSQQEIDQQLTRGIPNLQTLSSFASDTLYEIIAYHTAARNQLWPLLFQYLFDPTAVSSLPVVLTAF